MRRVVGLLAALVMTAGLGLVSVLPAQAAQGAVSDIKITVAADGTPPFSDEAGPGLDDGPNNGVVRTQDSIRYSVIVSYDSIGDVVLTSTLPSGMEWDATVTATTVCNGPGGGSLSADKRTWTCSRTADGLSESFDLLAKVDSVANGAQVAPEITSGGATGVAPAVTVSATPKTELLTFTTTVDFRHNVMNGTAAGFSYTLINYFGATNPAWDFRGYEALSDSFTYTMSVPEGAVVTSRTILFMGGTATTTQAAPGGDVTVTVTGARTGYANVLAKGAISALPADFGAVGGMRFVVWVPYDPTLPEGQVTTISSQLTDFDPVGLGGASNFGAGYAPAQEPGYTCPAGMSIGLQKACFTYGIDRSVAIDVTGTGGGVMQTSGNGTNGGQYLLGDGHGYSQNYEKVVPGQTFVATAGLFNATAALSAATAPQGCAVWDNTYLALSGTPRPVYLNNTSSSAFYVAAGTTIPADEATVEYSAMPFASDSERRAVDCGRAGDGAAGWVSSPSQLVGGLDAVTAVRMSSTMTLDPGRAVGIHLPLARTTSAASLGLPVNLSLPWFWQFGTAETPLVKSNYPGSGQSSSGGYVQAVPSLVRATTAWSDSAVDPGSISSVLVQPLVIGPVGVGVSTSAKNVAVTVTMGSVCAEPVEASLQALVANGAITGYDYTPGVIGGDGINCAAGGTPSVVTMRLGDVSAPGGAVGGSFHPSVAGHESALQPLSFQVANSVLTPSGSTHVATTLISADTDTSRADWTGVPNQSGSAVLTDRTTSASLVVTGVASFKGGKTASTAVQGQVAPGEAFAYTINWANGTSKEVGPGTFVDLLPYDGDDRGTSGLGAAGLQVVDVSATTPNPVMGGVEIQHSTQPSGEIAAALAQPGNEDGHVGITWQTGTVPATATALRFITQNSISPGYSGAATITVKAPTLSIGGVLKNNMFGRTAPVGGDEDTVMTFRAAAGVSLTSSAGEVSGTVYRDLNFNGVHDAGIDVVWPGDVNLQATSVANTYTGAVVDGVFGISPIAPGAYSLSLVDVDGWTRVSPLGTLDVASGERLAGQDVLYREDVAVPVLVDDADGVSQGEAVVVDVTGNDSLAFPQTDGSIFDVDTVALGGLAPTFGSVELVAPTGTATQSSIRYTASADWPGALAGETRYTDTFTYSWTNALGVARSATVTVTVYQPVVAVDDAARIADLPSHVDVLTNDGGDGLSVTGTPTVTSGDATVSLDVDTPGELVVTPTHVWGDDAEHMVLIEYNVADSRAQTSSAELTVTVQRKPVVTGEIARTIAEGTTSDFGYDLLAPEVLDTVTVSTPPVSGAVSVDEMTGAVTFDATGATPGDHPFSVTFTDDLGQATVIGYTVTVQAAPAATPPAAVTIPEQGSATSTTAVATTGTIIEAATADVPEGATVTASPDGDVTFVAGPDLAPGTYTFSVTYTDDLGQAVVVAHVVTVQQAPQAQDPDAVIVAEGGTAEFATAVVPSDHVSSAVVMPANFAEGVAGATIVASTDGTVTFDAGTLPAGTYVFDVVFTDDLGQATSATYSVTVQAAPTATGPISALTGTELPVSFDTVLTTTGSIADAQVTTAPAAGTVEVSTAGAVSFDPDGATAGTYTFGVTYTDDLSQTVVVTYTVVVQGGPLVIGTTDRTVGEGQEVDFGLTVVTEGTIDSAVLVTEPSSGSVTVGVDGSVVFEAGDAAPGVYTFAVQYTDNFGQVATVDLTVTVRARLIVEGSSTTVPLGGTASLSEQVTTDGFVVSREVVELPSAGTVTLGSVLFAAGDAAPGEYSFTVRYTDDLGQTADARYHVTVQAPPTGAGESITLASDTETAIVDPVGNSTGTNLQGLRDVDLLQPEHGTVALNLGVVTYLPERGYVGATTFSVNVRDDLGQSVVLDYTVTVLAGGATASAEDIGATSSGALALTGANIARAVFVALVAVGAGAFLLVLVRRRREDAQEG